MRIHQIQKISVIVLCIAGICLAVLLVAFSLVIRDPKLGKEQSLEDAEESADVGGFDSRH